MTALMRLIPSHNCPYCGDVMLNDYADIATNSTTLRQTCMLRPDHCIKIRSDADSKDLKIQTVMIRVENGFPATWAMWNFEELTLVVAKSELLSREAMKKRGMVIPFFVPDLSDYPKLVDKIKTYIVFT